MEAPNVKRVKRSPETVPTSPPLLPPTIDPSVAVHAIRSQRDRLLNLIRHCLPEVTNSLFAQYMIPNRVYDIACNENKGLDERGMALLDCIEARVEAVPSDFKKFIRILEAETFLRPGAEELVKSYSTISTINRHTCATASAQVAAIIPSGQASPEAGDKDANGLEAVKKMIYQATGDRGNVTVQGRTLHYEVEGGFRNWKYQFKGKAWDEQSQISVKTKGWKSADGARKHVLEDLVAELRKQ